MKKSIFVLLFVLGNVIAEAQVEGGSVGVTVSGNRVVQKNDAQWIYPSETELKHSSNVYSLLGKLSLNGIRVDQSSHSLTATDNRGTVNVRINDVPATMEDMLSIDMSSVVRIEYTDRPGLRYGEDVAYAINIVVKRPQSGYAVGADLTHDLTRIGFSDSFYGRFNTGKSEWGIDYSIGYGDLRGCRVNEKTDYHLTDGSVKTITRNDISIRQRSLNHNVRLLYSIADSLQVMQMRLKYSGDLLPDKSLREIEIFDRSASIAHRENSGRKHSPAFDVYYHRDLGHHQKLTASATVTHIATKSGSAYDEGTPCIYNVKGRMWSLMSEVIYENRLKPFTLTAGAQYNQKLTDNEYAGDVQSQSLFRSSEQYLFGQVSGTLFKCLQYVAGLGGSRRYYRQGKHHHDFHVFRPRVKVSVPLGKGMRLGYDYQRSMQTSKIALVNDVALRLNPMEIQMGNPALKPTAVTEHTLQANYNMPRWTVQVEGYAKLNHHPNMHRYIRTDDNIFIDTQENQPHCDMIVGNGYVRYDIIPDHLDASLACTYAHFDNRGNDYHHCYNSVQGTMMVNAYLGNWSLMAYADSGWRWMEGEQRCKFGTEIQFVTSYQRGPFSVSFYLRNPFHAHPLSHETWLMNENLQIHDIVRDGEQGNYVGLKFSFKLSHGRKYRDINRTIELEDKDAGILK